MPVMDLAQALAALAPNASTLCLECFALAGEVLPRHEINTPLRVSHFLAQVLHETGGLTDADLVENLNYRDPNRLRAVYGKSYFPTVADAAKYVGKPEALANYVYDDRNPARRSKLGNICNGDGAAFMGRGLIQITGRWMYGKIGAYLGMDLLAYPWLACHPEHALSVAAAVWTHIKNLNRYADEDDLLRVSVGINGRGRDGMPNGYGDRSAWLVKVKAELHVS